MSKLHGFMTRLPRRLHVPVPMGWPSQGYETKIDVATSKTQDGSFSSAVFPSTFQRYGVCPSLHVSTTEPGQRPEILVSEWGI